MAADDRDHELEHERILDGIVESILEAPEAELDDDLRAAGDDPDAAADRLRARLASTVERRRFSRRARAKVRIQQQVHLIGAQPLKLPESEQQRLRLLGAAIRRRPELEEMLRAKLGDLPSLSAEEVEEHLRQLAEMGELEGVAEGEN